jgi:hypothetical protein
LRERPKRRATPAEGETGNQDRAARRFGNRYVGQRQRIDDRAREHHLHAAIHVGVIQHDVDARAVHRLLADRIGDCASPNIRVDRRCLRTSPSKAVFSSYIETCTKSEVSSNDA